MDDLGHGQRPLADNREAPLVPVGIRDDVDGHREAELARDLQRLEVLARRDALAVQLERVLVQCFETEEHVVQPEPLPILEHLAIAQQHVAARLEVVLLAHVALLELAADREAVLGMDEGDVVHDEDVRLRDAREIFGGRFGGGLAIRAAVERPRAAERAIPGAAARQLGGGARVEHADEVLPALPGEVARGREAVEIVEHRRHRAGAVWRHDTRQRRQPRIARGLQQPRRDQLTLAADQRVERAGRVLEQLVGDERSAVASCEDEAARTLPLRLLGEVEHLGNICQIVQREADGMRREVGQLAVVVGVAEDLKIEQPHLVARGAHGARHALEPDRLEPQEDLGVHERTRVHEQDFHRALLYPPSSRALWARAIAPSGPTRSPSAGATSSGARTYPASTAPSSSRTRASSPGARITPPPMAMRRGDSTATIAATPSAR